MMYKLQQIGTESFLVFVSVLKQFLFNHLQRLCDEYCMYVCIIICFIYAVQRNLLANNSFEHYVIMFLRKSLLKNTVSALISLKPYFNFLNIDVMWYCLWSVCPSVCPSVTEYVIKLTLLATYTCLDL